MKFAIVPAGGNGLLPVEHAVLEGDHDLVQLAEQGHQLLYAQLFAIGADGAAGNAVVAGSLIELAHKVHLERAWILLFPLRRVPFHIFQDAFLVGELAPGRVQIHHAKIEFHMVQAPSHHFLGNLRRDPFSAC